MRLTPFYPLFEEAPDDSTPAGGGSMLDNAGTGEGAEPTGVAERPDYVPEKFWDSDKGETRLEALTKSYGEFEKKFHESGKFIGAPEGGEYEISLPEGIEAELNTEDPVLQWFQGQAAEMGLSQDAFTALTHGFMKMEFDGQQQDMDGEFQKLGENSKARVDNVADWAQANLNADQFETLKGIATNAAAIELLEGMISKTRGASTALDDSPAPTGVTHDDIKAARWAKDETTGRYKYETDPAYKKQVDKMYSDFFGNEPRQEAVG